MRSAILTTDQFNLTYVKRLVDDLTDDNWCA